MSKILCATRGGEGSYHAQDKAIALAKESGDTLVFLYIVDLHFLDKTAAPIVVDVDNEITKMGEFLLLMAKERAAKQGVTAETLIREGQMQEELMSAASEKDVSTVVLGRPAGEESTFRTTALEEFIANMEKETGAKIILG